MYFLADTTNNRVIARHSKYRALAALHFIQFANVDAVIVPLGENRGFSQFEIFQLLGFAASLQITLPPGKYNDQIKALRAAIENCAWIELPFTEGQLEEQALALKSTEDRPFAFNPAGNTPELLREWHFPPQRNRRRLDSSYSPSFTSGGSDGKGTPHSAPPPPGNGTHKAPPAPPRTAPATPIAPKPTRAPHAASSGPAGEAHRPKAGTSTGRVWDFADEESAKYGAADKAGKAVRQAVIQRCITEGINSSTASVQFGKWKSSKGL